MQIFWVAAYCPDVYGEKKTITAATAVLRNDMPKWNGIPKIGGGVKKKTRSILSNVLQGRMQRLNGCRRSVKRVIDLPRDILIDKIYLMFM